MPFITIQTRLSVSIFFQPVGYSIDVIESTKCRQVFINVVRRNQLTIMSCTKRLNIGFECGTPHNFVISQWQSNLNSSAKYLIYEWIFATYFNFVLILSIYTANECKQVDFYLIYLTNWNVMLNAFSSLFGAITKTLYYKKKIKFNLNNEPDKVGMTKLLKVYWLLSNLSTVVSISVSLAYWPTYNGRDAGLNDVLTHAGNSVILFADTFIHARPPRYGHFVYPLSLGIIYEVIFSLPYQLFGGLNRDFKNYIYPSLDWTNNTKGAIMNSLMLNASLVLVHIIITFSMSIRNHLFVKFKSDNNERYSSNNNQLQAQSIV